MEGLPKKNHTVVRRVVRVWLLVILAVLVFTIGSTCAPQGAPVHVAAAILFSSMFVGHFAVVIASILLQGRATKRIDEAQALVESDPGRALELVRSGLRLGARSRTMMRGWLIVARLSAEKGNWDDADRALRLAEDTRGQSGDREAVVHLHLQHAFVDAVRGHLVDAEKHLLVFGPADEGHPNLLSQWVRARALLLYKREAFREVVDFLEAMRVRIAPSGRDAALLAALEQSSLLRLQAGAHRIAAPSPDDDAWLATVAPELAARPR